MKQFEKIEKYPPELRGRFNSFITTEFDDSMTVEMQIRSLVKWIIKNIDLTNEMVDYLNNFIETFDQNLYKTTSEILDKWLSDGVFDELTNEQLTKISDELKQYIEDKMNNLPTLKYVASYDSYDQMVSANPNGRDGLVYINSTKKTYFWDSVKQEWVVLDNQNPIIKTENIYDRTISEKDYSFYSVGNEILKNTTLQSNKINPSLKTRNNLIDKTFSKEKLWTGEKTFDNLTLVKAKVTNISTENVLKDFTFNGQSHKLFKNDILENDVIKSRLKYTDFYWLINDIDEWTTAIGDSSGDYVRVRSSNAKVNWNVSPSRLYYFDVDTTHPLFVTQANVEENSTQVGLGLYQNGCVFMNVPKPILVAGGYPTNIAGFKSYIKSLPNFDLMMQVNHDSEEPTNLRGGLSTAITKNISYTDTQDFNVELKIYETEEKKTLNNTPISVYYSKLANNTTVKRLSEIAKFKIHFEDNECMNERCLKVFSNGIEVDYDFIPNISDQPITTKDYANYPSGFLKSGYIAIMDDPNDQEIRVEVYNQEVKKTNVRISQKYTRTKNLFELSRGDFKVNINDDNGFGLTSINYAGVNAGTTNMQLAYFIASQNEYFLNPKSVISISTYGDGTILRGFDTLYDTSIDGVKFSVRLIVYANRTIDVQRTIIFDSYANQISGIRFKDYFGNDTFSVSNFSRNSCAGALTQSINAMCTMFNLQFISNGGGDGINSPLVTGGSASSGGIQFTQSVDITDNHVPVKGEYYSVMVTYRFNGDDFETQEIRNMNPLIYSLSKKTNRDILKDILEISENYLMDNLAFADDGRFPLIRTENLIEQAKIENRIPTFIDAILGRWSSAVSYYDTAENIFARWKTNRGVEYTCRDFGTLKNILRFFNQQNLTAQVNELKTMVKAFADYYLLVEEQSGGEGKIALSLSGLNNGNTSITNAEAGAFNCLDFFINTIGNQETTYLDFYNRLKTRLNNTPLMENILPYAQGWQLSTQCKLHYHSFSLFYWLMLNKDNVSFDYTAYIEHMTNPVGKITEMRCDFQATRRGLPHTSWYNVSILLKKGDKASLETAYQIAKNIDFNKDYNDQSKEVFDNWITNEDTEGMNITIALGVVTEVINQCKNN